MASSWGVGYIIVKFQKFRLNGRIPKGKLFATVYVPLKMTVMIRSPLRWVFVFVTLFLLLEVYATGVDDTTDRRVSVLARPLLTLSMTRLIELV